MMTDTENKSTEEWCPKVYVSYLDHLFMLLVIKLVLQTIALVENYNYSRIVAFRSSQLMAVGNLF